VNKTPLAAGLLALALTTLTACGGDAEDSSGTDSSSSASAELEVLTDDQAQQALLSEAQMGEGFTAAPPTEDESDSDMGCLNALDEMDDIGAETEAKIEFTAASDLGLPTLENDVFSYTEIDPISARIEEVTTALEDCTKVDVTNEDGTSFVLDVSVDTETTSADADEQVTLEASGTVSSGDQQLPIAIHMTSVRIENHVSVLVFTDVPDDEAESAATFDGYVTAATDRLAAVVAGETPDDEPLA
jgi:hypothetical protein